MVLVSLRRSVLRLPALWFSLAAVVVLAAASLAPLAAAIPPSSSQWPSGGQNISDSHSNPSESKISTTNVGSLKVKWTFATAGDVSATPAVVKGVAYFPDWGGYLNAVKTRTETLLWKQPISAYDGVAQFRLTDQPRRVQRRCLHRRSERCPPDSDQGQHGPVPVDKRSWTPIRGRSSPSRPSCTKGSSTIGVSSSEEYAASLPGYPCCTFRGSMTAVNAESGQPLWQTYMVPANGGVPGGYSGGAVWGSTPALDPKSKTLYITTGNNYTIPASATTCETNGGTSAQCLDSADDIDSIVALNASTGAIRWAKGQEGFDTWTVACISGGGPNCPTDPGPDADFGSGAQLFTIKKSATSKELVVGAGQKSGVYWEADAATGTILWGTRVGPGGADGGMQWGSATDGSRIYVAEADSDNVPYTPAGSTQSITSGSWAALDPLSGKIDWQTPDPSGGVDVGSVSTANGVVYAGSSSGHMYALDAATGGVLWDYQGQGSSIAGPAIVNGLVYWGNGYARLGPPFGTPSKTFYAFAP